MAHTISTPERFRRRMASVTMLSKVSKPHVANRCRSFPMARHTWKAPLQSITPQPSLAWSITSNHLQPVTCNKPGSNIIALQ
jgi:hypothetical protein